MILLLKTPYFFFARRMVLPLTLSIICTISYSQKTTRIDSLHRLRERQARYFDSLDKSNYCNSLGKMFDKEPCKLLSRLGDSLFLENQLTEKCFHSLLGDIAENSGIRISYQYSGFKGRAYYNVSLGKSLYKHDLIKWNRYYGCPDTVRLKSRKYGSFTKEERGELNFQEMILKSDPNHEVYIDTTVFD
jgi:hypothetical protein